MRLCKVRLVSVAIIFALCCPFEIFNPVVGFIAIDVIDRWLCFGVRYECLCNKTMNKSL